MTLRASLSIVIILAIAAGANAQDQLAYEQEVLPSVFLRMDPADYLPAARQWESEWEYSSGEVASYDYLDEGQTRTISRSSDNTAVRE